MMQKDGKAVTFSAGRRQKRIPSQRKITPRSNFSPTRASADFHYNLGTRLPGQILGYVPYSSDK